MLTAAESSISVVKRRGSPSEEPNPLITRLVNDTFIKGVSCVLAVDENVVGMAEKLLEGTLDDLDAWQYFTSLRVWQNHKLRKKYSIMMGPTMIGPKQEHFYQQMHFNQHVLETKARNSDDNPSLKFLFESREHIWIVLILVILFWSPDYVHRLDDDDSDDDDETPFDSEMEPFPEEEPCCEFNDDQVNMLKSYENEEMMKNLVERVKKDHKIYQTLQEFLGTLHNASPLGAQKHFDKVKEVWGNPTFIDLLLEVGYRPSRVSPEISNSRLSKYIKSCIKKDPLFEMILEYDDPDFMMRVALSILIGFWSNQENIVPLVCSMGGDDLGVEKTQSGVEKEEPPCDWMLDTPNIMEFYRDKSIGEVADQLKELPKATLMARSYLESFGYSDCFCSDNYHALLAARFWSQPSVILKLNEAMKKNPNLLRVFTKFSKGAESLRRQERMTHIMKDVQLLEQMMWKEGSEDSDSKMRLALSILFGYWVDGDVTKLFRTLCEVQKRIGKVVYSSEEEIAAFYYYARCATDVEGLESWLAKKYGKASEKALYLAKQIGDYQNARVEEYAALHGYSDYSDWTLYIEVVLKNESTILAFSLYLYLFESNSKNTFAPQLLVGQQTVLC